MMWEDRFAQVEAALGLDADGVRHAERDREIDDLVVERAAAVSWTDRCLGHDVTLTVAAVGVVRGELAMATDDWLLLHQDAATDWVVATAHVLSVRAPGGAPRTSRGEVERRTTWRQAWAAFVRDRDEVVAVLVDGSTVRGVPVRAGKDYTEIGPDLVPYAAVAAIRCPR